MLSVKTSKLLDLCFASCVPLFVVCMCVVTQSVAYNADHPSCVFLQVKAASRLK